MHDFSILSVSELDDRIAVVRDNVRQLVEQAAGVQGSANDDRTSDRLEQLNLELDALVKERATRHPAGTR
jgi:hypothetical protein